MHHVNLFTSNSIVITERQTENKNRRKIRNVNSASLKRNTQLVISSLFILRLCWIIHRACAPWRQWWPHKKIMKLWSIEWVRERESGRAKTSVAAASSAILECGYIILFALDVIGFWILDWDITNYCNVCNAWYWGQTQQLHQQQQQKQNNEIALRFMNRLQG